MDIWNLETLWFVLIVVLWVGYFFLEGFDFGVGNLLRVLGKNETDRRALINTIGPFWDGNEVWLLVAGGATFAAFPEWYATMFSGFYLALVVLVACLVVRAVSFEYRGKGSSEWANMWDWIIVATSLIPSILWGVAFANILRGVPIDADGEYTGNFLTLLNPYSLLGGVASLALFTAGGVLFLHLKTGGVLRERATVAARYIVPIAIVPLAAFVVWTLAASDNLRPQTVLVGVVAIAAIAAAVFFQTRGRDEVAFIASGLATACFVVTIMLDLYPRVMVSSTAEAFSLTVFNAASTTYTLTVMTVVAAVMTPIVLLYQGWTYYVFRYRVSSEDFESMKSPIELLDEVTGKPGSSL